MADFLDPRDLEGQALVGGAPRRVRFAEEIFDVLCALEPEATAERRAQLMIEAKSQVQTPVMYFNDTQRVALYRLSHTAHKGWRPSACSS
jgi:hypothetical protein